MEIGNRKCLQMGKIYTDKGSKFTKSMQSTIRICYLLLFTQMADDNSMSEDACSKAIGLKVNSQMTHND